MIKLSKMTDYAVVILAEMAGHQGVFMSASGLSEGTKLPEPTVSKVLKILTKNKIIESVRGSNGGYSLNKAPDTINMAHIITALEGPIVLTACVDESDECCEHAGHCHIKGKWNPVNQAMNAALQNVSLAQMIGSAS